MSVTWTSVLMITRACGGLCRQIYGNFGTRTTCQIVLITEGVVDAALPALLEEMQCKLHIVMLGSAKELQKSTASNLCLIFRWHAFGAESARARVFSCCYCACAACSLARSLMLLFC